jgi:molybdopterin-containing oxidoreductase family iron-sulfur binding subunit
VVVESHEGRPTKIEGNELHPQSGGAVGALQQAETLNLYDPDRSKWPTEKGAQKTWADFVTDWREQYPNFVANQGQGLAVLSQQFSSPTLARLKREFQNIFPQAKWVVYEPVSDENIYEGIRAATGQAYQPVYRFDQAQVVLSLDADFLLKESDSIRNTRGFTDGRRVQSENDAMNRLYVVESTYTITGAMADHRMPLQGRQISAFAAALAVELSNQGLNLAIVNRLQNFDSHEFDQKWLTAVAKDLIQTNGKSLVVAGRHQPATVHAIVVAMNSALGNIGNSVNYYPMQDKATSNSRDFAALVSDMEAGAVNTLVILDGNPVYDTPADLNFVPALSKVETTIHFGLSVNETAQQCIWHIPSTHFLESWGDVRAEDGTLSVIQPLIAPLFAACHSDIEFLSLLNSGTEMSGYEIVRQTWQAAANLSVSEKKWQKILHDGLLENSTFAPVAVSANAASIARQIANSPIPADRAGVDSLEVAFVPCTSVFDGRYANNGWMQEMPDPVTKIVWDNVALVSMKFAKEAGIQNGDLVLLEKDQRSVRIPAWILPGQADYTITVALGYGREAAGRVGTGVGFNTYKIRTLEAPAYEIGFHLKNSREAYKIANVQDHGTMDGRPLVREGTLEDYREEPDFAPEMEEAPPLVSMWKEHKYDTGYQWGMTIDLNVCTGCNACMIACQSENNIPVIGKDEAAYGREMHWIRLDRYFTGEDLDNPGMAYQPVACQHCEMAPCEEVCPVSATVHDEEGLNVMIYNRCIGTRYCSNNCPYKVRRFNWFNFTKDTPEIVKMAMNPDVTVRFRGVMEKCTFCLQRINEAKYRAKSEDREVRDGEIKTACQQTCPADAIVFGNINDPESAVTKSKKQNRNYELLAILNLRTRNTFLAKIRNPNPELAKAEEAGHA